MRWSLSAFRQPDGQYGVVSGRDTYHHRNLIKQHGGRWDSDRGRWVIPEEALSPLGIERMVEVVCRCEGKDDYTHLEIVPESSAVVGRRVRPINCGYCYCERYSIVTEVVGEVTQWQRGRRASHAPPASELPPPGPSNIVVRTPSPLPAPERVEDQ